jgi:lipase
MASPLFISRFGRGAPVLCLHGVEAHGLRFVGLAARLEGFEIIAPDLRGHARSPRQDPFTLDQHVRDLLPLLNDLGPGTTLLGHSYGGLIAWELARAAPSALARLVLVDPAIEVEPAFAQQGLESASMRARWPDRATAFRDLSASRRSAAHWAVALDVAVGLEDDPDGRLRVAVADDVVTACWDQVLAPLTESSFRGPTLVIEAGQEQGAFCTPSTVGNLRRQLGDRLRRSVVDLPHTIPTDGPDVLADHLLSFLVPEEGFEPPRSRGSSGV